MIENPKEFFTDTTHIFCMALGASAMGAVCFIYKCVCK
jgi:hypothetical protein